MWTQWKEKFRPGLIHPCSQINKSLPLVSKHCACTWPEELTWRTGMMLIVASDICQSSQRIDTFACKLLWNETDFGSLTLHAVPQVLLHGQSGVSVHYATDSSWRREGCSSNISFSLPLPLNTQAEQEICLGDLRAWKMTRTQRVVYVHGRQRHRYIQEHSTM